MDQNNNMRNDAQFQQNGYQAQGYQQPAYQQTGYQQPYQQPVSSDEYAGDPKFKPMSAWAYAGYMLLYSVVPFGWIAAIIHATNNDNINRRNFARGYWCMVLLGVAIGVLVSILIAVMGISLFNIYYR